MKQIETSQEAIEEACSIVELAYNHLGSETASDCFCGKGGFWNCKDYGGTFEQGYRNDGEALAFVRKAVEEKIAREAG